MVSALLKNPVYQSLLSGDRHLGSGTEKVKVFDEAVSPFAGFKEDYAQGFDDLYDLLPAGRKILYAAPFFISEPKGWFLLHEIKGLQFIFNSGYANKQNALNLVPLQDVHIGQMMELAALTKPGPFGPRTIEFGHYYGIIKNDQLVAMTGQRLHVQQFAEVSAVCTHPAHLGKGYAAALVQHQINLILSQGQVPFLHVRADNLRAIELYQRIGFTISGAMNFYLMKREQ